MSMTFQIKSGDSWIDLPEPARGGLTITEEPIWASNTGRSTTGKMLGDIIATKATIEVTWPPLSKEQTRTILGAITAAGPFFKIRFTNDVNTGTQEYTVYASSIPRTVYTLAQGINVRHLGVTITFIEQ